jgi:hypothetical protein
VEVESASSVRGDGVGAVVEQVVVSSAEQDEVVQVGAAAADPVGDVMGLQAVSAAAAGVDAASVAEQEGLVLAFGDDAVGASEVEHAAAASGSVLVIAVRIRPLQSSRSMTGRGSPGPCAIRPIAVPRSREPPTTVTIWRGHSRERGAVNKAIGGAALAGSVLVCDGVDQVHPLLLGGPFTCSLTAPTTSVPFGGEQPRPGRRSIDRR